MVKKNLNKKVGCALIAAGLLAASSVQGSSTSERDFSTSPQTVAETIQREAVLWNWSQWEGHTRAEVWFPRGYRIVFEQYDENGEKDPTIFLLPNGDMTSLSELRARNFPGFTLSDFNSVKVLAPERIKPCYWFHGVISLCPPEYKFRFTNGGLRAQLNDGPWEMIPCIRRR
jgi:hypothetical protein